MSRDCRTVLAALAIAMALGACSSGASLPTLPANATADEASYRLGPGDKLNIKVVGAEDLTGDYPVGDNGAIGIPLIGDVHAAGLTRVQLERAITAKLAQGYIRQPRVNVSVLTYRPFYIYGEVAKPGSYPYASGMRVLNAIATAGGFTYRANQSYVVVTRHGEDARAGASTPIQPDDVIKVPERLF